MSNQPPARPWFRLASLSRPQPAPAPAPAPTPTPAPAPATQPRPSIIARPAFRPVAPPPEPTPPPPPPPATVTAPRPAVTSPPPPTPAPVAAPPPAVTSTPPSPPPPRPPIATVTAPAPPPPQQPTEFRAPRVTGIPSVPSSPSLRPSATTASLPQFSTTVRPSPPSPKKETSPPEFARGMPPPSSPARKDTSPKSPSPSSSISSSSSTRSSPEVSKPATQIPSPEFKPATVPTPSPLVLPPSQIRAGDTDHPKIPPVAEQQKTVLVQKPVEKPKPAYNDPFKLNLTRLGKQDAMEGKDKPRSSTKKRHESEDGTGTTIITIAGDNTGAVMDIVQSPKKHGFTGKPHFLFDKVRNVRDKMLSDDSESESSSSTTIKSKDMTQKLANKAKQSLPMHAYMNSNVQSINNSIVYNSSCSHHDPGVHLALTKKPADGGLVIKERANVNHSD